MHYSRIAAFLLGALLAGNLFMAWVATGNFQAVSDTLKTPPPQAEKMIRTLGDENARMLLRYLAGEENRRFFQSWETIELILGVLLAGLLFLADRRRLLAGLAASVVILAALEHFKITPELVWQGRSIDFVPATADSTARQQFYKLHAAYGMIEAVKLLLILGIGIALFPRRRRARERIEVNAVDYADHGHVDR